MFCQKVTEVLVMISIIIYLKACKWGTQAEAEGILQDLNQKGVMLETTFLSLDKISLYKSTSTGNNIPLTLGGVGTSQHFQCK